MNLSIFLYKMTEGVVYLKLTLSIKKSLKYLGQINQNLVNLF